MTKIAIIGTAPSSMEKANDLDDSWKIFCCNAAFNFMNRFDLHFELHDLDYMKNEVKPDPTYWDFFRDAGAKIVLNKESKEFPLAQVYPLKEVIEDIGSTYFNNTIAYMVAFALYRHPEMTDLALIGVDMVGNGEYSHQRPCTEFYLGLAKGRGVTLHLPESTPLLKNSHLYGFESLPYHVVSFRNNLKTLKAKLPDLEKAKQEAISTVDQVKGMIDLLEGMVRVHQ